MKDGFRFPLLVALYSHVCARTILLLVLIGGLFCRPAVPLADPEGEFAEVLRWREKRLQNLQRDDGWLTLAGAGSV